MILFQATYGSLSAAKLLFALIVFILASLFSIACDTGTTVSNSDPERSESVTVDKTTKIDATETLDIDKVMPKDIGLAFPKRSKPSDMYSDAYGGGKLIVQDGCIRLAGGRTSSVVVWPYGYSLGKRDEEIYILNEKGEAEAKIGDEVSVGGGTLSRDQSKDTSYLKDRRREFGVPDRCRGSLQIASPGIKVVELD